MTSDGDLDAITLRGMKFHALVGILPHEREYPQPLEIDLTAWIRRDAGIVDYRHMYAQVKAAMDSPALLHLEKLADSIATRVLKDAGVERVRIAVRKPHAAVGGPLEYAEVAVVRSRNA